MTKFPQSIEEALAPEPDAQTRLGRLSGSGRGPVTLVLDLFSSIWLGIWLLAILFVYCAIGSVGIWLPGEWNGLLAKDWVHEVQWFIMWTQVHVRQSPALEMTEFEWFHWWPFNLNIALICVNLVVATLRRIPLNVINLGVWMIHTGIIILAAGSVMYFSMKLEGDAPVIRRQIVVHVDGHPPVAFAAQPGASKQIRVGGREYVMRVMSIDPHWELLSGEDAGKRAYMVSVAVQSPGHQFVRQLIAGYPQYTEDTIWTGRQDQPMVRAVRELGVPIVDESIQLTLDYHEQDYFYLMDSRAIYLREKGETQWVARPIHGLPRYNDRVDTFDAVWHDGRRDMTPNPLEVRVKASHPRDPLPDTPIFVTSYLRYAVMETQYRRGGTQLNPLVVVRLADNRGQVEHYEMAAFDDRTNFVEGGRLQFVWAGSEADFERLTRIEEGRLRVRLDGTEVDVDFPAEPIGPDGEFTDVGETGYSIRIERIEGPLHFGGGPVTVAIVSVQTPERTFRRWVFDTEAIAPMDFSSGGEADIHGSEVELDTSIKFDFEPGRTRVPVTIIGGPREEDLHLLLAIGGQPPSLQRLSTRRPMPLQESVTLEVLDYSARTEPVTRPSIIPPEQRDRDAQQFFSIIRTYIPGAAGSSGPGGTGEGALVWLPHHQYAFAQRTDVMRRFPYRPTEIAMEDGRVIEVMYSRDRRELPGTVILEDFEVVAHIGGFTGETASIRDWVSRIRFQDGDQWTDLKRVSMNQPANYRGFWFFQAKWDPPDPARGPDDVPSAGLNYTVLGVGNRHGVWTQLFGCCVAVTGMIYAFYVKPILKRRRMQAVYAAVANGEVTR